MDPAKKTAACEVCGGRNYVIERRGDFARARPCECSRPCKICGGQGHTYAKHQQGPRTYEVLAPCTCRLLDGRVEQYNQAAVPAVVAHASFENFGAQNAEQHDALERVKAFALGYGKDARRGFILSGPVGSGKTHLLSATLAELLLERGVAARYAEISFLYATIRRGFQEGKSGGEIIQPLSEIEVLAIDELGKGRGSTFELETMDELIARRYNAGRLTLFATNYSLAPQRKTARPHPSPADTAKAPRDADQLLRERVTERIYSRLLEMCEFVEMPASTRDYRHTRHELDASARPGRKPHGRS